MLKSTKKKTSEIKTFPVLPLRDMVLFPGMLSPIFVGREISINALLSSCLSENDKDKEKIILLTQKDPNVENPKSSDLYSIGTIGQILKTTTMPDNTNKVYIESMLRVKVKIIKTAQYNGGKKFLSAEYEIIDSPPNYTESEKKTLENLVETAKREFSEYVINNKKLTGEMLDKFMQLTNPGIIADTIVMHLTAATTNIKQCVLETNDYIKRIKTVIDMIDAETYTIKTDKKIKNRVKRQMEKTQKEYYLNEQLKAIYRELGDVDDFKNEIREIEATIKRKLAKFPEAYEKGMTEIKKLKTMSSTSSEAAVIRGYLDCLISMPWSESTKIKTDLIAAEKKINETHYCMQEIKDRIIEYLAVCKRTKTPGGSIMCFVGPPGIGKTSLAKTIANATGRNYIKISLGGISDESEIRGHRRTYIGAMPGKIIQALRKAKKNNPLLLLDEIDKLCNDVRGDPSSALLEVLDPEQNKSFLDHYLDLPYDLSNVMFIATANTLQKMSLPLVDRMEVISLSSYTESEKMQITKLHIIKKQMEKCGITNNEIKINDDAILTIIQDYTMESGLRNLEKVIAKIMRKALRKIITTKKTEKIIITNKNIADYCGIPKYRLSKKSKINKVGMTTGLAYTEYGGDTLTIEALLIEVEKGGTIQSTGKLGDVMKESIQAAYSYVKSIAKKYGVLTEKVRKSDIHIHVPEGATPKDGPSAGIAISTSILSAYLSRPVRADIAMTGEITLSGSVLAIGGIKEKLLAATREQIKTVIIPKANEVYLSEISEEIKKSLDIRLVSNAEEVFNIALQEIDGNEAQN